MRTTLDIEDDVLFAAFALIVDAKSPDAKASYEHYDFRPCVDALMTLYLPLG